MPSGRTTIGLLLGPAGGRASGASVEDLRDRVLEGSLTAKMLQESIASIDAMDYTDMYQSLNAQMTSLEAAQFRWRVPLVCSSSKMAK